MRLVRSVVFGSVVAMALAGCGAQQDAERPGVTPTPTSGPVATPTPLADGGAAQAQEILTTMQQALLQEEAKRKSLVVDLRAPQTVAAALTHWANQDFLIRNTLWDGVMSPRWSDEVKRQFAARFVAAPGKGVAKGLLREMEERNFKEVRALLEKLPDQWAGADIYGEQAEFAAWWCMRHGRWVDASYVERQLLPRLKKRVEAKKLPQATVRILSGEEFDGVDIQVAGPSDSPWPELGNWMAREQQLVLELNRLSGEPK